MSAFSNGYWPSRGSGASLSKSGAGNSEMTGANFGPLLQGVDTVEISTSGDLAGQGLTAASSAPADQESQSASDPRVKELIGEGYNQRTATVMAQDTNDPTVMTPEYTLTSSDKQMLQQLAGNGKWQDQSSLFRLACTISMDRISGKLTGDVSASYIQAIKDGKAIGNANVTEPGALLPDSVLDAALAYIKTHPSKLSTEIVDQPGTS